MDNINDILRAKRIVRQNGYRIEKPARDYDYEREDRMNLIRAKRIVKDAGYSYSKPMYNTGVNDNTPDDDFEETPRQSFQRTGVDRPKRRFMNNDDDFESEERPFQGKGRFVKRNNNVPAEANEPPVQNNEPNERPPMDRRLKRPVQNNPVNNNVEPPVQNTQNQQNNEVPPQTTPQEEPRRKTRQEIYADIAARYV